MTKTPLFILLLLLFSCGQNEEKTKSISTTAKTDYINSEKDIQMLRDFLEKEQQDITDENGFRQYYEVRETMMEVEELGVSDSTTAYFRQMVDTKYLNLSISSKRYEMFLNGEMQRMLHLVVQIYDVGSIFKFYTSRDNADVKVYSQKRYYIPELDSEQDRINLMRRLTSNRFFDGYNNGGKMEDVNIKVNNSFSNAIKNSGILEFKRIDNLIYRER